MRNVPDFDVNKPARIADLIELAGVGKASLPVSQMLVLAILAGIFIGFGAAAYTMVVTGADLGHGPTRFLGGVVFSLGLILVIVGGAELFTGNALMVMVAVDKRISASLGAWWSGDCVCGIHQHVLGNSRQHRRWWPRRGLGIPFRLPWIEGKISGHFYVKRNASLKLGLFQEHVRCDAAVEG